MCANDDLDQRKKRGDLLNVKRANLTIDPLTY